MGNKFNIISKIKRKYKKMFENALKDDKYIYDE
jgi:hypothetical protein